MVNLLFICNHWHLILEKLNIQQLEYDRLVMLHIMVKLFYLFYCWLLIHVKQNIQQLEDECLVIKVNNSILCCQFKIKKPFIFICFSIFKYKFHIITKNILDCVVYTIIFFEFLWLIIYFLKTNSNYFIH